MFTLTLPAARSLQLASLGLLTPPTQPADPDAVLQTIRALGALQIDTISVVARSPYFVLWSRLGDYDPTWLDELLPQRAVFEYWAHAACFIPIEDYPLYRRRMLDQRRGWWDESRWLSEHVAVVEKVRDHLNTQGAVRSADFERPKDRPNGWWAWKDEKMALEMLFDTGEVMITRRESFQRVYDLRERVNPDWDDSRTPTAEETAIELTMRTVDTLGVALQPWIADYFRLRKNGLPALLNHLVDEGRLIPACIEGLNAPAFIHPNRLDLAHAALRGDLEPTNTTLLSPFDPLVWHRDRARALFNFDYTIECYTPAPKRRYGYFTLPILHRGALIGRLDAKAHRKEGLFEVRNIFLEEGVNVNDALCMDLRDALVRCASWHRTPQVVVHAAASPALLEGLSFAAEP